jgi:molybdopterin converting factor subunit 1
MRVTVQLFARLRELAGRSDAVCEVTPGASVADVWRALEATYPAIRPLAPAVSAAVNAEFAAMTTQVHEGDEVAFLPPVSGGAGVSRLS